MLNDLTLLLQPLAAIDDLGLAREQDFAVLSPEDFERAAGHRDLYVALRPPADHRGDGRRARARARRKSLARAALPDARLDVLAVEDAYELDVRALWEGRVRFDCAPHAPPVHGVQVLDEGAAVRVAHLQGRDGERLAAGKREPVVAHLFERLGRQHRNRDRVEARPPYLRLEAERLHARA